MAGQARISRERCVSLAAAYHAALGLTRSTSEPKSDPSCPDVERTHQSNSY